jgi:hypothetical protein
MINLFGAVRGKTETWMHTWVELTFTPRAFFASLDRADSPHLGLSQPDPLPTLTLSSLEFFWGAQIVAYLFAAVCAISFFMDLHAPALRSHLDDATRGFGAVTTVAGFAVLSRLLALWLIGAISFGAYHLAGSKSNFRRHMRVLYYLTNTDFLPAGVATLLIMFQDPYINSMGASWDYLRHSPLSLILLTVWSLVLVYNLTVSYVALGRVHGQPPFRRLVVFAVGFTPVFLTITAMSTWLAVRLIALALVKNFD